MSILIVENGRCENSQASGMQRCHTQVDFLHCDFLLRPQIVVVQQSWSVQHVHCLFNSTNRTVVLLRTQIVVVQQSSIVQHVRALPIAYYWYSCSVVEGPPLIPIVQHSLDYLQPPYPIRLLCGLRMSCSSCCSRQADKLPIRLLPLASDQTQITTECYICMSKLNLPHYPSLCIS